MPMTLTAMLKRLDYDDMANEAERPLPDAKWLEEDAELQERWPILADIGKAMLQTPNHFHEARLFGWYEAIRYMIRLLERDG